MKSELKAIETKYKGFRFRSRLEARWAVFFDALNIKWEYEKEGFDLGGTWYLPDFWFPLFNCYGEVKPKEKFNNKAFVLCKKLVNYSDYSCLLLLDSPDYCSYKIIESGFVGLFSIDNCSEVYFTQKGIEIKKEDQSFETNDLYKNAICASRSARFDDKDMLSIVESEKKSLAVDFSLENVPFPLKSKEKSLTDNDLLLELRKRVNTQLMEDLLSRLRRQNVTFQLTESGDLFIEGNLSEIQLKIIKEFKPEVMRMLSMEKSFPVKFDRHFANFDHVEDERLDADYEQKLIESGDNLQPIKKDRRSLLERTRLSREPSLPKRFPYKNKEV